MFLFVATNMAIFCKCSKLFREDDVGALTLSSRAGERIVERVRAGLKDEIHNIQIPFSV